MIVPIEKEPTPGRNDPCPCGSGLKFKRCCLNKPADPSPKYKMRRVCHWDQDEIRGMPTEQIIAMLESWGIRFNQDDFLKDAKECSGACDIYERWEKRLEITAEGFDVDFVWMACQVLWERLVTDKISTEQIDDLMQDGYDLIEKRAEAAGCRCWLIAWEELKKRFNPSMKSIKDADPVFRGMQLLSNWCQDVEMELRNAGTDDKTYHEHRIRYCREFCNLFPESSDNIIQNMKSAVAESLIMTGRQEEGDKAFQAIIDEYPDDPWGYIKWGDTYTGSCGFQHPANPKRAEELYRMALGKEEDDVVRDRIKALKAEPPHHH